MFVAKWEPGVIPKKPELSSAPIWLELRNVPLQFFNEEGLEHVAVMVGEPKCLHPSTANKTNLEVAKVFTVIYPRKPLPEVVNVQFPSGEIVRILVSSPWMPPVCSHCKGIEHTLKRCPTAPITCSPCKSTTHSQETCPRLKEHKEQNVNRRKQKKHPQTLLDQGRSAPAKATKMAYVRVSSQVAPAKPTSAPSQAEKAPIPVLNPPLEIGESSGLSIHCKASNPPTTEDPLSEAEPDSSDTLSSERGDETGDEFVDDFQVALSKRQHKVQRDLGKIWVLWDPSVQVVVVSKSLQMVTCEVLLPEAKDMIIVSIIYASNEETQRKELWAELVSLANSPMVENKPWIALGDFNQVLNPDEHSNPPTLNVDKRTRDLRDSLVEADL
ncbi:PREDICTED: uncharacterized protein LOC104734094 [Camelina sativa]|uniref:Uncharacterized protein LOC104734094 n=1 Tax=Camelina sativa TaxID=90675 RepID=A0ABM0V6Z3_CAMSA|nr:PREDICTED: uncharacterized protein LOC104734094 [Camelina sativa]